MLLYDHLFQQLELLISRFGLQHSSPQIVQTFELLCAESLARHLGRPPYCSTLNEDGTPFQFSLVLGRGTPGLQFLCEVGSSTLSNMERMALTWEKIDALATLLNCEQSLSACRRFLVPDNSVALSVDPGGVFWIGVGFFPERRPRLRIYINSSWDSDVRNWARLDSFASFMGVLNHLSLLKEVLDGGMRPLGFSLVLNPGRSPDGRLYVRAYGNPFSYYERVARDFVAPGFAELLKESAKLLVIDEYAYPSRSVVCSVGFDGSEADFKCEFCGHCIFSSDAEAVDRCRNWLAGVNVNGDAYFTMMQVLTDGRISKSHNGLHSFVGLGTKGMQSYCTLYFNPGASGCFTEKKDGQANVEARRR